MNRRAPLPRMSWREVPRESVAGVVTALALIPEVVSFSVIAGVPPQTALVASVVLLLVTSVLGARPAMVTAASGAVALVVAPLVRDHGVEYLLPAVVLAGVFQVAFGLSGLAPYVRLIPRSVIAGFVTGLGILIFVAQVPHVLGGSPLVWVLLAVTVVIVVLLPRLTKAVPSPLVAVVVATVLAVALGWHVPMLAEFGPVGGPLPPLTPWLVPFTPETFGIILPTALSIAGVGIVESLLVAQVVDDSTRTPTSKSRESWALGAANVAAGFYGGIGGCAMIGQTAVNVEFGRARRRLSTVVAALVVLLTVTVLEPLVAQIPVVALAGVMMVVAVRTVDWGFASTAVRRHLPWAETVVWIVSVALIVATENLAVGVAAGCVAATLLLARRMARSIRVDRVVEGERVRYLVHGPLFFANVSGALAAFRPDEDPADVRLDLAQAQVWDATTVHALDRLVADYAERGAVVRLEGMGAATEALVTRLSGRLG